MGWMTLRNVSDAPATVTDRQGETHEIPPDDTILIHPRDGLQALRADPDTWERVRTAPEEKG